MLARFCALVVLLCLSPLIALFAFGIQLHDPGPIFFRQARVGRDGKLFRMWKLRSMVQDAEQRLGDLLKASPEVREEWTAYGCLENDPRIAGPFARMARLYSVDELPQLVNVITGDMAWVGPRPILPAQAQMVEWDLRYIAERSTRLDLQILLQTPSAVLSTRGAY